MSYKETFEIWSTNPYFDEETRNELLAIKDDEKEIEERFYKELEFGTGGLRGIIAAGTNRINRYTVRKASQGVAQYIVKQGKEAMEKGIAIAYDSRFRSPEFAKEAALVFAANGIKAYLFDELRPTPVLSFTVRHLGCSAGVVVTASHNPKEYNGYKVYGEDGGQLPDEGSRICLDEINAITDITKVEIMDEQEAIEKGLLEIIGKNVDDAYIAMLKELSINPSVIEKVADDFKLIYTPLHGSGNKLVRRILAETGFKNVIVVKEQELPDSAFSTVKSPNPEEKSAFEIAIELAKKENSDLIIGTDPDCDRVGVVVRAGDEYKVLTGNQTGMLLCDYILSAKKETNTLPNNAFIVKTIVTTELARVIAESYGVELVECLTGFKYIGEQIKLRDEFGDQKYLFGFEESYGYLAGTSVRDKDGVVASMLIGEMAAWYKSRGMSLYDGLQELFAKYGYSLEGIQSYTLQGKAGVEKIQATMQELRDNTPTKFGDIEVSAVRDYKLQTRKDIATGDVTQLPLQSSNVLYFEVKGGDWFCVRPSGTEPKIKVYFGVRRDSLESAEAALNDIKANVLAKIEELLK